MTVGFAFRIIGINSLSIIVITANIKLPEKFRCDDIVADVNRMNFDIYGCDIDTLNDSVFGSLYVEKMKYDKNVYIVHLKQIPYIFKDHIHLPNRVEK